MRSCRSRVGRPVGYVLGYAPIVSPSMHRYLANVARFDPTTDYAEVQWQGREQGFPSTDCLSSRKEDIRKADQ